MKSLSSDLHSVSYILFFCKLCSFATIICTGCRGSSRIIGAGGFQKKPGSLYGIPNPKYIKTSQSLQNTKLNKQSGLFSYNDARKPNVPKIDEKPVLGIRSNKNFIVTNAVEAIVQGNVYIFPLTLMIILNVCSSKTH